MDPWFVTGLTDGEGSFGLTFTKNSKSSRGWNTFARFRIELHKRDLNLLKAIQSFFSGVGHVGLVTTRDLAYFEVKQISDSANAVYPSFY